MKRIKKMLLVASLGLMIPLISLHSAFAFDKLIIVANQKAVDMAKDFLTMLNNESIPVTIATEQFDKVKNEKYIIVLGGAKGAGSVDEFVNQILTPQEQAASNQPGGAKAYFKDDVFTKGQSIIVFAGPDEKSAADARVNSRKLWLAQISKWFELDTSTPLAY